MPPRNRDNPAGDVMDLEEILDHMRWVAAEIMPILS
jgi:hypothetical protein